MQVIGPASEDDMLEAFVLAEIDSPRFGLTYGHALAQVGVHLPPSHLRMFLAMPAQRPLLAWLLRQCRGYGRGSLLFREFPAQVSWYWCEHQGSDFGELRYPRFADWLELTGGSLRVSDGVARLLAEPARPQASHVEGVLHRVAAGWTPPPPIVVRHSNGTLALLEGCVRSSALALRKSRVPQRVLMGTSPTMDGWAHW